jgi:CheY-like chemotaxis protein
MSPEVTIELVKLIPSILWVFLVAILIAVFYRPIRRELLPKMQGIHAFGIEVTFLQGELDKAIAKQGNEVSQGERSQVLRRAQRVVQSIQGAQILWVDDNPDNNIYERGILRSLGLFVDLARTTNEALSMISQTNYAAVISDMNRNGVADEGLKFLTEMRVRNIKLYHWTIFYAAGFDPSKGVPPHAFGMTNRPDYLLHLVLDILERKYI